MSERGTFVTEYIYCEKCLHEAKKILIARHSHKCSELIRSWEAEEKYLPIISGKISGTYPRGELVTFEYAYNIELSKVLCHPLRIAVLAESGERIFTIEPTKDG